MKISSAKRSFFFFIFFSLGWIFSCSQYVYIGAQKQQVYAKPKRIIFLQVAGLDVELVAKLREIKEVREDWARSLVWENALCVGELWQDNFYSLSPDISSIMNMQLTGNKNQLSSHGAPSCKLMEQHPFWDYLEGKVTVTYVEALATIKGLKTKETILLNEKKNNDVSLSSNEGCEATLNQGSWPFSSNVKNNIYFPLGNYNGKYASQSMDQFYREVEHPKSQGKLKSTNMGPSIYQESPCLASGEQCLSQWWPKVTQVWTSMFSSSSQNNFAVDVFYLRDNSLLALQDLEKLASASEKLVSKSAAKKSLKTEKPTSKAILNYLMGLNDFIKTIRQRTQDSVTTSIILIGVPGQKSQVSTLWAWGARAHQFCGLYHSSQLLDRFFFRPL